MTRKATIEEDMSQVVQAIPRLPRHGPEEFEPQQSAIEYAPPSVREDFTEAAAAAAQDLPAERAKVVERGLVELQRAHADRDRLVREQRALRTRIAELETILATRTEQEGVIADRVNQCLADRDAAVAEIGELRGVLNSLAAVIFNYQKPLVEPAHDDDRQGSGGDSQS